MTIVFIIAGSLLYGFLLNHGNLELFTNTSLSLALLVPLIVGIFYGPLPAGICAFTGSLCADLFAHTLLWYDWAAGSFVMGFMIGMFSFYRTGLEQKFTLNQFLYYALTVIVGNLVGYLGITPLFTHLIYPEQLELTLVQTSVAVPFNIVLQVFIGFPLLAVICSIVVRINKQKNTRE